MRFVIIHSIQQDAGYFLETIRQQLSAAGAGKAALAWPVHLTLRTGLLCPDDQAGKAADDFLAHAADCRRVALEVQDLVASEYGPPENPKGFLGLELEPSRSLLELHSRLLAYKPWAKSEQTEYHPHITLAYEDCSPAAARELLPLARDALERLPPLPWLDRVELWHQVGEVWKPWGRVGLN